MSRIAITLAVVAVFSGLAYYVFTHPDRGRVEALRQEFEQLKRENDELARQNARLEREIVALRNDSRAARRRARRRGGLARPDEYVIQFGQDGGRAGLEVTLEVGPEEVRLAGEAVELKDLGGALEELARSLPESELTVEYADDVGPLRRERVRQAVQASPLGPGAEATPP